MQVPVGLRDVIDRLALEHRSDIGERPQVTELSFDAGDLSGETVYVGDIDEDDQVPGSSSAPTVAAAPSPSRSTAATEAPAAAIAMIVARPMPLANQ